MVRTYQHVKVCLNYHHIKRHALHFWDVSIVVISSLLKHQNTVEHL